MPTIPHPASRPPTLRRVPQRERPRLWQHAHYLVLAAAVVASACADRFSGPTPAHSDLRADLRVNAAGTNCGASATIVTNEKDDLMTQYGMDARSDTLRLCETWTGSDYTTTVASLASSDDSLVGSGAIRTTSYANGSTAGYDQSGNVVAEPAAAGGNTLFDVVLANTAQRQASYDDPYYGLGSSNGCVPTPPALVCLPSGASAPAGSTSVVGDKSGESKFTKHGLHRRGVRALVDDGDEIGRSPEGYRRFQIARPGLRAAAQQAGASARQVIVSVDPKTELIMAEEATGADGTTKVHHTWKQTSGGYVHDQTVVDGEEQLNGRRVTSHAVITYLDVRINAPTGATPGSGS